MKAKFLIYVASILLSPIFALGALSCEVERTGMDRSAIRVAQAVVGEHGYKIDEKKKEKRMDDDTLNIKRAEEYRKLLKDLSDSSYIIVKGKAISILEEKSLSLDQVNELGVINSALSALKGKISVPEGVKAIIRRDADRYVVIIGTNLPKGIRGPDYTAKVVIDSNSMQVLQILGGS